MGRKRVRHSQNKSITNDKGDLNSEDWISKLPNDVIVSILSRMTLKEAASTSVLSSLWRYLWTCVTSLKFDSIEALGRIASDPKLRKAERSKYINWVKCVNRQYRGPIIENYTISFDLDKTLKCANAIDKWIKFALAKGVQGLKLDLLNHRAPLHNYTLRYELLGLAKQTSTFDGFKCLKSLLFKHVNVSSKVLEYLLSNCPLLEYLSVYDSEDLADVKIAGSSPMLKHLEILFCSRIEKIEICDSNLVSLTYLGEGTYLGKGINVIVSNVPMLEKVWIKGGNSRLDNHVFGQLSCIFSQLRDLKLILVRPEGNVKFPEFPKLRKLTLGFGAWADDSLLEFTTPLINACPYLERFVLQLFWATPSYGREVRKAEKCFHQHLKLVEMYGFYGRASDFELINYFIENAVSLRKIIIDPRTLELGRTPVKIAESEWEEVVRRDFEQQLEAIKPPGVVLEIL